MFAYRARGFDALVGAAQCVVHWGALWAVVRFNWLALFHGVAYEELSSLSGYFGLLCWVWIAGIGAELLWCNHLHGDGSHPEWSRCWSMAPSPCATARPPAPPPGAW